MSALPAQSRYIIGTEACERFSFYGMKSILMLYMTGHLLMSENWATATLHVFAGMVYLLPLAGAWLADKVWGRYKTILYISLLYCVGHGVLATADLFHTIEARRYILMTGLFIIALGAGGIKPCVSAFMGDQIPNKSPQLMTKAFNAFYWAINLGSFFSFLVITGTVGRLPFRAFSWASPPSSSGWAARSTTERRLNATTAAPASGKCSSSSCSTGAGRMRSNAAELPPWRTPGTS